MKTAFISHVEKWQNMEYTDPEERGSEMIKKKELEISQENKAIKKKIYDLSFNIPSFNDQKAFNNFRKKSKKHNFIFEKNFPGLTLSNKFNQIESNNI